MINAEQSKREKDIATITTRFDGEKKCANGNDRFKK